MNDDSVFYLQDTVTDIPLSGTEGVQDEVIDPRQSQQYCLQAHERKKKFLSQLNIIPHKIVVSDEDKDDKLPANSNAHNYEMISNPRDTPFFSLHGPKYDGVAWYFDPRRTKTKDILGQTIYQQQVFLNVQDEIPATNDILFENCLTDFNVEQSIDLPPLDLGGILKEDGELSKTFSLNQDSPKTSVPVKNTVLSTQDEFDDYRDLLIDVLITRNPLKMSNTLKTSSLLQKVLNIASLKDVSPGVISNGDEPLSSFVVEKSVVGDKSLSNTPKVAVPAKKSTLLRLASDPNHSFIDEFDRSMQPSSSSTPRLKPRTNAQSKRKKIDPPKSQSPKLCASKLSTEQLNKRQKIDKYSTAERSNCDNDSSRSLSLPLKPNITSGCTAMESSPQTLDPVESQKMVRVSQEEGPLIDPQKLAESHNITMDSAITENKAKLPELTLTSETETDGEVVGSRNSPPHIPACETASDTGQCNVTESAVELCIKTLPDSSENGVDSGANSYESQGTGCTSVQKEQVMESASGSFDKENYSAKKSNNDLASAVTTTENSPFSIFPENRTSENIVDRVGQTDQVKSFKSSRTNEASPYSTKTNKKVYSRDVCNAKESEVIRHTSPHDDDRRKMSPNLVEGVQNGKDKKLIGGSKGLLDAGLMSIRQIKGTDNQGPPKSPSKDPISEPSSPSQTSPVPTLTPTDEKLKPLAFKDRAIGLQLMKYCSCWIEETKHSACVDLYGEFLVTINNRYCQQLDMSIVNAALSVLSSKSDKIDPDNCILKTALFTTELLKVLTSGSQAVC